MKCAKNGIPIHEIMSRDRFIERTPKMDRWENLGNGRACCPKCRHEFLVDTWMGEPYWKFCPMCGMPKEIDLW